MEHIETAKKTIRELLLSKQSLRIPYSSGKDSSTIVNLTVSVAAELIKEHGPDCMSPLTVINADSKVENPEITAQLNKDILDLKSFCSTHHIPLSFHQSTPALGSEWIVKILSGRNLPVFSNRINRDCSIDLKILPMKRLEKKLLGEICKKHGEPVTLLGTRFAESSGRTERMEARGESADKIWHDPISGSMLSPIANWNDQMVWDYIAAVSAGRETGFTDFIGLTRLYIDGSEKSQGDLGNNIPSCRFGCCLCTVLSRDRSMDNLLNNNPERYGYMDGINRLQQYLVATQYDFDKRQLVGRTIKDGFVGIGPAAYSHQMLEDLFLMVLTLDAEEAEAADRLGIEPRFQFLHPRAIIAIDAIWSMQGIHKPFHGLRLFKRVYREGYRKPVPQVEATPRTSVPTKRYLHVGEEWNAESSAFNMCGLRDISLEMALDSDSHTGCGGTETLKNGRTVMVAQYSEDGFFDVDEESAMMILTMELDYLLERYSSPSFSITTGYRTYVTMGVVQLSSRRQTVTSDYILRRTAFREQQGLIGTNFDLASVLERTISEKEKQQLLAQQSKGVLDSVHALPCTIAKQQVQLDMFSDGALKIA